MNHNKNITSTTCYIQLFVYNHIQVPTCQRPKHADMLCVLVVRYSMAKQQPKSHDNETENECLHECLLCIAWYPSPPLPPPPSPVPPATVRVPLGVLTGDPVSLPPPPPPALIAPTTSTVLLVSPSPSAVLLPAARIPAQLSVGSADDVRSPGTLKPKESRLCVIASFSLLSRRSYWADVLPGFLDPAGFLQSGRRPPGIGSNR